MPVEGESLEEAVYDKSPGVRPYDPASVEPHYVAPPPGEPEDAGSTREPDESPGEGAKQDTSPTPAFDPRFAEEFTGLLYVGALTDEFEWLGHSFKIRTLTTGELAEVALIIKQYQGTEAAGKTYQAAVVAGCILSVDGRPLPSPITTDPGDTPLRNRFHYVMQHWFGPVIDAVYERYYSLEITVREVLDAMGNRSG